MSYVGRLVYPTAEPRCAILRMRCAQPPRATVSEACCPAVGTLLTVRCSSDAKKRCSFAEQHYHGVLAACHAQWRLPVRWRAAHGSRPLRASLKCRSCHIKEHQPPPLTATSRKFHRRKLFPSCWPRLRVSLAESAVAQSSHVVAMATRIQAKANPSFNLTFSGLRPPNAG
jgi:hypothetical protein